MTRVAIDRLDHFVLTVANIDVTCAFYKRVLGMKPVNFGPGRVALSFGRQKINLHPAGNEYEPKAKDPTPGSGDICLISETNINDMIAHLESEGVEIIEGPSRKTGAMGPITSIYFRDPDGNLVEVSNYN